MCTYYFKLMPLINIDAPDGNSAAPMMDYSIVLLRPKNEVKLSTQSAKKSICMGKWPVPNWGIYFRPLLVLARVPEFFTPTRTVP